MPPITNPVFQVEIVSPVQGDTVGETINASGTFDIHTQTYGGGLAYIEIDDENGDPIGSTTPVSINATHISGGQYTWTASVEFPTSQLNAQINYYYRMAIKLFIQVNPPPWPYRQHAIQIIPDDDLRQRG